MEPSALLKAFCSAVERRDGKGFASLFTEDGVYHDVFYGAFKGHAKIAEMIDDWFYRTAHGFRWEMHRPVSDGKMLYAYYTFSYVSKLPEAEGKRVGFEGVSIMTLRDGKIAEPVRGAMLIGNGPDALTRVAGVGNDMALDPGMGNCGKAGQWVPVGVGQPTVMIGGLTVGGSAT